jgi:Uma2 family endonuclease
MQQENHAMRIALPDVNESLVLENISWEDFESLLDKLGDRRSKRLAYDQGRLEIMSPSKTHERIRRLFELFLYVLTEEFDLECVGTGSATFRRADLKKGVEGDASYYLTHEKEIRRHPEIDLHRDPPPDLVIEIEVTRKSLDRFAIYLALGVPEIWRYHEQTLEIYQLRGKAYKKSRFSRYFPDFPVAEIPRFLERRHRMGDNQLAGSFRQWVRGLRKKQE